MTATFSPDRVYRYDLLRWWVDRPESYALWIMLNPSTADETKNDPTIRKCIAFSQGWGYDGLVVVNIFALRSPHPKVLKTHPDPIGPDNDQAIAEWVRHRQIHRIVCAWGAHGVLRNRGLLVRERILAGIECHALGFTKSGHPTHPRFVHPTTALIKMAT